MCLHPTTLLTGLLLAILVFDFKDAKIGAAQPEATLKLPTTTVQQADAGVHTFHRGSGRRQFFLTESALTNA